MNAVESLKSKKAHPVEILEVLCKDFLATIIDSQSTEIQLSSLKINTFQTSPIAQREADYSQKRYDELFDQFSSMRRQYTKELAVLREKAQMQHQPSKLKMPQAPVFFFEDLRHLLQQTVMHSGERNPDFISKDAQLALQQRFEQVKAYYESQLEQYMAHSVKMQEQMTAFKQVQEASGGLFKVDDISIDRMVRILAVVVQRIGGQQRKGMIPFDVWMSLEQHLGSNFFQDVISQFFGLAPETAQGLMTKFKKDLDALQEWATTTTEKNLLELKQIQADCLLDRQHTESNLSQEIANLWNFMSDSFDNMKTQLQKKYKKQIEERQKQTTDKYQALHSEYSRVAALRQSLQIQNLIDQVMRQNVELEEELAQCQLKHDVLEYNSFKLEDERYIMLDKIKQYLLEIDDLRHQVSDRQQAYWKILEQQNVQEEVCRQQNFYIEALESELERNANDLRRAQLMNPDLQNLKINPSDQIKRQLLQARNVLQKMQFHTRHRVLLSHQVSVSSGTDIQDLSIPIIEQFRTQKRNLRVPHIASGVQTDTTEGHDQMNQTWLYTIERGQMTTNEEWDAMVERISQLKQECESRERETVKVSGELERVQKEAFEQKKASDNQIQQLKIQAARDLQELKSKSISQSLGKDQTNLNMPNQKKPTSARNSFPMQPSSHQQPSLLQLKEPESVHIGISSRNLSSSSSSANKSNTVVHESAKAASDASPSSNKVLISKLRGVRISTSTQREDKTPDQTPSSQQKNDTTKAAGNSPYSGGGHTSKQLNEFTQAVSGVAQTTQLQQTEDDYSDDQDKKKKSRKRSAKQRLMKENNLSAQDYKAFVANFNLQVNLPNTLSGLTRYFNEKQKQQTHALACPTVYTRDSSAQTPQHLTFNKIAAFQQSGEDDEPRIININSVHCLPQQHDKSKSALSLHKNAATQQRRRASSRNERVGATSTSSYRQHLINSFQEPDYYKVDKERQEINKLKHLVKGRQMQGQAHKTPTRNSADLLYLF